jgi:DMSO/TMAO reductase YedYZ molybdopterin-dependent catalytic subunit
MQADAGPRLRPSAAFVAGVSAMLLATGLLGLASLVQASVPFPPLGLAQRLLHLIPGRVDVFFIDLMGHWALRSFAAGFTVGSILAGGVAAMLVARVPGPGTKRTAAIWGAAAALAALAFGGWSSAPGGPSALTYAALVGAAGAVFALALSGALGRLERDLVPPPAQGLARTRREFLRAAVGAGGLVVAGLAVRRFSGGTIGGDRGGKPLARPADAAPVRAASPPAADTTADRAFLSIPGLTPEVTPNRLHYVVDESIIDPNVDSGSWRLRVDGLVGQPLTLTYQELLAMPAIEQYVTLQCISNLVGGDLVSTAKWTGAALKAVLARAGGVAPGAVRVVFHAVGGYTDSLPVAKALDGETVVAYGMNGQSLPRAHGYPARIVAPGIYGMKCVKWLQRIEVVNYDYQGYWQRGAGWDNIATIKTASRIDVPPDLTGVKGEVVVAGLAWAGDRRIDRVEVSFDGGTTWTPAILRRELARAAWRQWRLPWRPTGAGKTVLKVRALDGQSQIQPAAVAPPYPSGATGYQQIEVITST